MISKIVNLKIKKNYNSYIYMLMFYYKLPWF